MTIRRGEIWIANLDPTQGSEQAGGCPPPRTKKYGILEKCAIDCKITIKT
ncbi:hypothetical protein [Microcoleus sp. EPA2]